MLHAHCLLILAIGSGAKLELEKLSDLPKDTVVVSDWVDTAEDGLAVSQVSGTKIFHDLTEKQGRR